MRVQQFAVPQKTLILTLIPTSFYLPMAVVNMIDDSGRVIQALVLRQGLILGYDGHSCPSTRSRTRMSNLLFKT